MAGVAQSVGASSRSGPTLGQGPCPGCGFLPQPAPVGEAAGRCFSLTWMFLFLSPFLLL